jgi:glycosyltransferase involved in cell wall biosynthesis
MPRTWTKSGIINRLAEQRGYRSYLELCTPLTGGQFGDIDRTRFDTCHRLVYCCSDTFDDGLAVDFKSSDDGIAGCVKQLKDNKRSYDVIFVDGVHEYEPTIRDLRVMFDLLAPSGLMLVHDCLPLNRDMAAPKFKSGEWTGTAYKAFIDFVNERTDLFYCTIDADYGCGLIRKKTLGEILRDGARGLLPLGGGAATRDEASCDLIARWKALGNNFDAAYDLMAAHRQRLLGVVTPENFTGTALGWPDTVRLDNSDDIPGPTIAARPVVHDPSNLSIAVIIPLHNGARYIEMALHSVLGQSLRPDEIIVVDDGSVDGGPALATTLASQHPITLITKPNGGQSSARNFGVAHANTRLIAFLDQDDYWYANHLEKLIEPFRAKQDIPVGWVYSDVDEIDHGGALVNRKFLRTMANEHPKVSLNACLANDMFILPSASLILREAFDRAGGFDERLMGYEDDDLFIRLFSLGFANVFIEQPLSQWRIHSTSASYSWRMSRSRMIYAEKLYARFPDDPIRRRFLGRDLIAPRMARAIIVQYELAVRRDDRSYRMQLVDDLRKTATRLQWSTRWAVQAMLPLMRFRIFGWLMAVGLDVRRTFRRR